MTSPKHDVSTARLAELISAKNDKEADEVYTKWSETYEDDLQVLGCVAHVEIVENAIKVIENTEASTLLDAAAGTGLCGEVLMARGYKGKMDALELNEAMLKRAKDKSIYRHHYLHGLSPDLPLPVNDNSYDTIICSGSLAPNHVEAGCMIPMFRALKPGGMIAFNTRETDRNKEYNAGLIKLLDETVSSGKIEKVVDKEIFHYKDNDRKETVNPSKAQLYIYKKLSRVI